MGYIHWLIDIRFKRKQNSGFDFIIKLPWLGYIRKYVIIKSWHSVDFVISEFHILFYDFTHLHKAGLPLACHSQKSQWMPQHWQQPAVIKDNTCTNVYSCVWINQGIYVISLFDWIISNSTLYGKNIFFQTIQRKHAIDTDQKLLWNHFIVGKNYHANRFLWTKFCV